MRCGAVLAPVLLIASAAIGGCGFLGDLRVLGRASVAVRERAGEGRDDSGWKTNVLSAGLGMVLSARTAKTLGRKTAQET
jgi:hypothetical protein